MECTELAESLRIFVAAAWPHACLTILRFSLDLRDELTGLGRSHRAARRAGSTLRTALLVHDEGAGARLLGVGHRARHSRVEPQPCELTDSTATAVKISVGWAAPFAPDRLLDVLASTHCPVVCSASRLIPTTVWLLSRACSALAAAGPTRLTGLATPTPPLYPSADALSASCGRRSPPSPAF